VQPPWRSTPSTTRTPSSAASRPSPRQGDRNYPFLSPQIRCPPSSYQIHLTRPGCDCADVLRLQRQEPHLGIRSSSSASTAPPSTGASACTSPSSGTYLLTSSSLDLAPLLPQIPHCVGRAHQTIGAIVACFTHQLSNQCTA
jgi:hypothetical protein